MLFRKVAVLLKASSINLGKYSCPILKHGSRYARRKCSCSCFNVDLGYSIFNEMCTPFVLCSVYLWFDTFRLIPIIQGYFTGTGVIVRLSQTCPDSKVHRANMETIWGRKDPDRPHIGPMNFAIWVYIHVHT